MSNPLFKLDRDVNSYQLTVLASDSPTYTSFFQHHFKNRDSRLGLPVFYDRVQTTDEGTKCPRCLSPPGYFCQKGCDDYSEDELEQELELFE